MPTVIVSAVVIRDDAGRILVVRKRGTSKFMLPGGKIEPGETPVQAAVRELSEEVGAVLDEDRLQFLGTWTAAAANEPGHHVTGHIFEHRWLEGLGPHSEIAEAHWLHPGDMQQRTDLAPLLVTCVLPHLLNRTA